MSLLNKNLNLIDEIVKVSEDAGEIILEIYKESKNKFILKDDNSPLTNADTESNKFIVRELKKLTPQIPVLSEEEKNIPFDMLLHSIITINYSSEIFCVILFFIPGIQT